MNHSIQQLRSIASTDEKYIIGLMSGTSLDGLDIALCKITGHGPKTDLQLLRFKTIDYPDALSQRLHENVSVEEVSSQSLTILNTQLGDYYARTILQALDEWNIDPSVIDCIASHGQSIYHAPKTEHNQTNMPNATLQMGDGDHIARQTGICTISDFRQKHTAAGGEGAPLASYADELLFRDKTEARILLNIGGMANFVFLPADLEAETLTTDTGPGNTLINKAMQRHFDEPYDHNGAVAARGSVQASLLATFMDHDFLAQPVPKSTGPEMFNMPWVEDCIRKSGLSTLTDEDLVATLTYFTAQTIADTIQKADQSEQATIYGSGGGIHNARLMKWLEELLQRPVHSFSEIGFEPDAKEAACFAVLANETLAGTPFVVNDEKVNFGKISLPV